MWEPARCVDQEEAEEEDQEEAEEREEDRLSRKNPQACSIFTTRSGIAYGVFWGKLGRVVN